MIIVIDAWTRTNPDGDEPGTALGWSGQAFDRSYRSAQGISARTLAADQPGGLPGVLRLTTTRTHLEGGFTLRCFQRLSLPNVATQLWA
jgi:hypothetical protein